MLHPKDPSANLTRRFEDALFTFERSSWGCTRHAERALLLGSADGAERASSAGHGQQQASQLQSAPADSSQCHAASASVPPFHPRASVGSWLTSDGHLLIEAAISSARVIRPPELAVETKIGSGEQSSSVIEAQAAGSMQQQQHMHAQQHQASSMQWVSDMLVSTSTSVDRTQANDGRPRRVKPNLALSHSAIAQALTSPPHAPRSGHGQLQAVASPGLPPPLPSRASPAPAIGSVNARGRSLSSPHRRRHSQPGAGSSHGGGPRNGTLSPPLSGRGIYSSPSNSPPAMHLHAYTPPLAPLSLPSLSTSLSPPVTPMLEYIGTDIADEDEDSYALRVQTRRFGASSCNVWRATDESESGEREAHAHDGRSNAAFLHAAAAVESATAAGAASPPPLQLPPCLSSLLPAAVPLDFHPLTSTTRHGFVCVIRNSQFTDPRLPQLIGYEVDEGKHITHERADTRKARQYQSGQSILIYSHSRLSLFLFRSPAEPVSSCLALRLRVSPEFERCGAALCVLVTGCEGLQQL